MTDPRSTPSSGAGNLRWLQDIRVTILGSSTVLRAAERTFAQFGAHIQVITEPGETRPPIDSDVVLVDRTETVIDLPGLRAGSADEYLRHVRATNTAVWVTVSPFGLAGERRDAVASELTISAAGGFLGHARVDDDLAPTMAPGLLALKTIGQVAVLAALHGVHERLRSGSPIHVDVSGQAALVSTGLALEMGHVLARCPDAGGSLRYGAPTGFFRCLDGWIYVVVLEQHQWTGFQRSLAPLLDSIPTLEAGRDQADDVNDAMSAWAAELKTADAERILQDAGVACSSVNSVRTFVERTSTMGRSLSVGPDAPGLPATITEHTGKASSERTTNVIPLSDVRVLDAGHVLAVPLGAAWLGAMGAQVTKAEDTARLDIYRRRGPFAGGIAGVNRSGYFNQLNFSKTPLSYQADALGSTLDTTEFDVVLQNVTPRRALQVGTDPETVTSSGSPTMAIVTSGYGRTGTWADYRAYGHNVHAFCGVTASTRNPLGDMADMGVPLADCLTSVAVAIWTVAWSLATDRSSSFAVDISMAEVMAAQLDDLLDVDPDEAYKPAATGAEVFVRLPGSKTQLAVALRSAEEVAAFESIIGAPLPPLTRRGELVDVDPAGVITTVEQLEAIVRTNGLAAALVLTAAELAQDTFLRSTGLLQTVSSPTLGEYDVVGLPWTRVGVGRRPVTAAPEHS